MTTKEELREALAAYAHEAWSGWMAYLFSKCNHTGYGLGIPGWAVDRWQRQCATAYTNLPESEKESDRAEADKMLALLGTALDAAEAQLASVCETLSIEHRRTKALYNDFYAWLESDYTPMHCAGLAKKYPDLEAARAALGGDEG